MNFHHYYAWPIYNVFQKDIVKASLEEPEIPEETGYYLKEDRISVADVMKEMNLIRTGLDWPRRISLYASIDPDKESALTKLLEKELQEKFTYYIQKLYEGIECIIATHDKVVPHSRIVMGEGVTYCASPTLAFERDSKLFWEMIREQMKLLHKKDLWGSVITTTHAPERNVAWPACKERYIEANSLFLGKEN